MKKLLFTVLIAVSLVSTAFATDVKLTHKVSVAFKEQYADASGVQWDLKREFAKASFVQDGKKTEVFYNYNGERIGTSSSITLEDLPTYAKRAFAKKYPDYAVTEAIEFESENEVTYFLSAVHENEKVILQVRNGALTTFKK